MKIPAVISSVSVVAEENAMTGNFDVRVGVVLNGVVYKSSTIATEHIERLNGSEAVFNDLVERARREIVRMLRAPTP